MCIYECYWTSKVKSILTLKLVYLKWSTLAVLYLCSVIGGSLVVYSVKVLQLTPQTQHVSGYILAVVFESFTERTLSESYFSIQQWRFLLRRYGQNPFITGRDAVYIATRLHLSVKSVWMWFFKRRAKPDWKSLYDLLIGIYWLCNDCK